MKHLLKKGHRYVWIQLLQGREESVEVVSHAWMSFEELEGDLAIATRRAFATFSMLREHRWEMTYQGHTSS